ncbi:septal ring lytic transglycosylase RlpA family protein [Candidatus Hydrogenedentota bacterium]
MKGTFMPFVGAVFVCLAVLSGCAFLGMGGDVFQKGLASWYGDEEQGNPTASGEPFNKNAFTAAHRDLKFGTIVRVTNLNNGKRVDVRINDRGPFYGKFRRKRGRVIDLSKAAAKRIDMLDDGIVPVTLKIVYYPPE